MISGNEKPTRDWREIAAEAAKEKNEEKLYLLMDELERALDERDILLWGSRRSQKSACATSPAIRPARRFAFLIVVEKV